MRSKHDIKNLTKSSVSVPLKTTKTKFELIPLKMQKEIHLSEDYSITTNLLDIPMDPNLHFLERADREHSENRYS